MIPIAEALEYGNIRSAYKQYDEIRDNPDYYFDEYELTTLYYQLISAKKFDLARDALDLNMHVFPKHLGTYMLLAKHYLSRNNRVKAET
jgi:hypothetical protein